MTLIIGSQVRMDLGGFMPSMKETGGNAIKHYNILTVQMTKLSMSSSNWPWAVTNTTAPPKSFPVRLRIKKAKMKDRYDGNEITMYFYKGKLDHKFNVLAVAKNLGLHDGKTLKYIVTESTPPEEGLGGALGNRGTKKVEKEFKAKGFQDMYKRVPDEAVDYLESQLMDTYTKKIMIEEEDSGDTETEE